MDDIWNKYKKGTISKITYKKIAIEKTLQFLHSSGYKFINTLGSGSFGTVIKVKEPETSSIIALKITLEEDVTEGEKIIWPNLQNHNILSLKSHSFIKSTHTFIFKMPAHPFTLCQLLNDLNFQMDFRALPRAKMWLQGIISGLQYLHSRKCYHLDLKSNNVLISASDYAIICDFTFLTQTEDFVTNYGSPLIFKPPETVVKAKKRRPVDGAKYDVYTLGLLALELFSGLSFSKEISKMDLSGCKSNYWCEIIYPCIFSLLAPPNFLFRMQLSFPTSLYDYDTVDNIRNLIVACLNLNPAERPSADQLLDGKLFEGEKFWYLSDKDLWNTPVKCRQVENVIKKYRKKEDKRRSKLKKHNCKEVGKKYNSVKTESGVIKTQENDVEFVAVKIHDSLSVKMKNGILNSIKGDENLESEIKRQDSNSKKKKKEAPMTSGNVNLKHEDIHCSIKSINTSLDETVDTKERTEERRKEEIASLEAENDLLKSNEKNAILVADIISHASGSANTKNSILESPSVTDLKKVSDNIGSVKMTEKLMSANESKQVASIEVKNSASISKQENINVVDDSKCSSKSNVSVTPRVKNLNQMEDNKSGAMMTSSKVSHSQSNKEDKDVDPKSVEVTTKPEKNKGRIIDWFRRKGKSFSRVFAVFRPKKKEIRCRSTFYI